MNDKCRVIWSTARMSSKTSSSSSTPSSVLRTAFERLSFRSLRKKQIKYDLVIEQKKQKADRSEFESVKEIFSNMQQTRLNIFVIFTSDILCWACSRILIRFIVVFLPVIWREFPRVHNKLWMDRLKLRTSHQVHQIQECRASVNQGQFD